MAHLVLSTSLSNNIYIARVGVSLLQNSFPCDSVHEVDQSPMRDSKDVLSMVASPSQHVQWTAFSKQLSEVQAIFPILEGQQSSHLKSSFQSVHLHFENKQCRPHTNPGI